MAIGDKYSNPRTSKDSAGCSGEASQTKDNSQVLAQLQELVTQITRAEAHAGDLVGKLEPVLRPAEPGPDGAQGAELVPLAAELSQLAGRVEELGDFLVSANNRLEL